jgi:hypothetical protein
MKTKFRVLVALAAVVLVALWLVGCDHYTCSSGATFGASSCTPSGSGLGSGGNNSTQTAFVFLADGSAGQIAAEGLNVGNTGTFAPVAGFVPPQLPQPAGIFGGVAIVAKKYLYAPYSANNGGGPDDLFAFSITPANGALTAIGSPIPIAGTSSIAADPNGKFVFVGGGGQIAMFTVNPDGSLTAGTTLATGVTASQMTTDGLGRFLYAIEGSSVSAYSYSASGLSLVGTGFASGIGLGQIAGDMSGNFLLGVTNTVFNGLIVGTSNQNVYVMGITQSGSQQGSLTTPTANATGDTPGFIAVSPTAEAVYTFNTQVISGQPVVTPMRGFTIGSTGTLSPIGTFSTIFAPLGRFDQSGNFIFAHVVDPNTALTSTAPLAVAKDGSVATTNFGLAGAVSEIFVVTDEP